MATKIALLCTFSTVPRTLRMAKALYNAGYEVSIIEWDRSGLKPRTEIKNGIVFKRLKLKAAYGLQVFYLIPFWFVFVFTHLLVGDYHIVQPQNLDCLIPTLLATKLIKRKRRIIYDLADFYSDAYVVTVPVIRWLCAFLERLLIRRVDAVILVSDRQVLQIKARNLPERVILFYNIPDDIYASCNNDTYIEKEANRNEFTLFYAGILSRDRVSLLMNVIKAVKGLQAKIVIAGFGEKEDLLRRLSEVNKQLVFLGYLDHDRVMGLMKKMDIILLPYDTCYINNIVGLPNKFFEAMVSGCLILAPRGTYMGEIVESGIGITVNYKDPAEIRQVLKSLMNTEKRVIRQLKENAKRFYIEKFNPRKMYMEYLRLVRSLVSE